MAYYRRCPCCGAYLDPGEVCVDCREEEKREAASDAPETTSQEINPQLLYQGARKKSTMKGEMLFDGQRIARPPA